MTYTTPQHLLEKINGETNLEVLRGLVIVADSVIMAQKEQIIALDQEADDLTEELLEVSADAHRYAKLKTLIPALLEHAANLGPRFSEILGSFEVDTIDGSLDTIIALDSLAEVYKQQEAVTQ